MAHFARIENNVVQQVIAVSNEVITDKNGVEKESLGIEFCAHLFGGTWVQTSYNRNFRKNYAGIGSIYDPVNDEFVHPNTEEEVTE